jgi:fatty acid desaturase
MTCPADLVFDLTELRTQLRDRVGQRHDLLRTELARPLIDIAADWCVVLACVSMVTAGNLWWIPLALVLIGNRQRALGNILHDAGHRNLSRDAQANDRVANVLVAPFLFSSLSHYRAMHFAHHLALGDPQRDPDFLPIPAAPARHWVLRFAKALFSARAWFGSVGGHLVDRAVPLASKTLILACWVILLCGLGLVAGRDFLVAFVALWFGARATVFHVITTFREMCDHVGLEPGGIFSFTRDVTTRGFWRWVIHPRNNGYHLTHHLCPSVPYFRLPEAHRLFRQLPAYRDRATQCNAYFSGAGAVTRSWALVGTP